MNYLQYSQLIRKNWFNIVTIIIVLLGLWFFMENCGKIVNDSVNECNQKWIKNTEIYRNEPQTPGFNVDLDNIQWGIDNNS